jgi:hypothetical protein
MTQETLWILEVATAVALYAAAMVTLMGSITLRKFARI